MGDYRNRVHRTLDTAADRARRFRWRIRLLTSLYVLMFVALGGRAAFLMVAPGERLATLARRQHQQVVTLYPQRGALYDRHGVELALSVELDSVYADPKLITDRDATARNLAPHLKLTEQQIKHKLSQPLRFVWLGRRIGSNEADRIRALKLHGVFMVAETTRFYPNKELAGNLLGFVDIDNVGIEGLERAFNDTLNGKISRYVRLRDAKGRNITPDGVLVRQNLDGGDVTLTLDRTLQFEAETALNAAQKEFNARGGFIIVMDPRTGDLLAIANTPGYNPNAYGKYPMDAYKNQAAVNGFEPGSTQKVFLIAAALNERLMQATDTFDCEKGKYRIGRNIIHDTHDYGVMTVEDILKVSSNIGTTKIGEKLGKQRMYEYYRSFGFGESTQSGLPGEIAGILHPTRRWSRVGLATHAFGQGMTVTGLQIASALSALANGGVRVQPRILLGSRDRDGHDLVQGEVRELERVLSKETAQDVARMMVRVTQEGGTGTKAAIKGYTVAGKTGTAQKVDSATRRYAPGVFTSSFVGFLPAEDPRLVIVAILDEPRGGQFFGGTVAAPMFAQVARAGMRTLGIPPTEPTEPATPGPLVSSQPTPPDLLASITSREGADPDEPLKGPELKAVLSPEGQPTESYILPDFNGQPMRAVLAAVENKLVALRITGTGIAVDQQPRPGETVKVGDKVSLVFSPDGASRSRPPVTP